MYTYVSLVPFPVHIPSYSMPHNALKSSGSLGDEARHTYVHVPVHVHTDTRIIMVSRVNYNLMYVMPYKHVHVYHNKIMTILS